MYSHEPEEDYCMWCGGIEECASTCITRTASQFPTVSTSNDVVADRIMVQGSWTRLSTLRNPKETLGDEYGDRLDVTH